MSPTINKERTSDYVMYEYGSKFWSLPLRLERRLRVFENRVLRRIFEPQRDEIIG
jgi:hypothetical protein